MNDIPRWAAVRAYDRAFGTVEGKGPSDDFKARYITLPGSFTARALAEMIAKYEEPPVDPAEVVLNDIADIIQGVTWSLEKRKSLYKSSASIGRWERAVERIKEAMNEG